MLNEFTISNAVPQISVPPTNPNQTVTKTDLYLLTKNSYEILILIGIYVAANLAHWIKNKMENILVPNSFEYNYVMGDWASRLLTQTDADRVTIGIFTNGEYYLNKIGIKYMSIPIEKVSPGTTFLYGRQTSIPINTIAEEIMQCELAKNYMTIHDVNDKNLQPGCKSFLTRTGVKYIVNLLIPNHGFIGIQYNKRRNINQRQVKALIDTPEVKESLAVITQYVVEPRRVTLKNLTSKIIGR